MINFINKFFYVIVSVVSVTFVTMSSLYWVWLNQATPFYDTAGHTTLAYIYANVMLGKFEHDGLIGILNINNYYPPLMHMLGGVLVVLLGYDFKILQYASVLFLPAAFISTYVFTYELTKERVAAVIAATFFILFPHVWEQSRYYMLDLPLTVFLIISSYSLLKSKHFSDFKWSLAFFTFAGFAQLTKWYAFLYLIFPLLYVSWKIYNNPLKIKRKAITFLVLAAVTCSWVMPWFVVNLDDLIRQSILFSQPDYGDPVVFLSVGNTLFYLILIINYQVVSLFFLWLVISIFIIWKKITDWKIFVIAQVAFIYLFFTFGVGNKNLRYIMPMLPFLAIIMGQAVFELGRYTMNLYAKFIFLVLVVFGICFLTINSFAVPFQMNSIAPLRLLNGVNSVLVYDFSSTHVPYMWTVEEEVQEQIIEDLSTPPIWPAKEVLVVSDQPQLSVAGLRVYSLPEMFNAHFIYLHDVPNDKVFLLNNEDEVEAFIEPYTHLLIPKDVVGPVGQINYKNMESIRLYVLQGKTIDYVVESTYSLANGEEVYLLRKDKGANQLRITLDNDKVKINRNQAIAQIYFQVQSDNGDWVQAYIDINEYDTQLNLVGKNRLRIDYPPGLMVIEQMNGWGWGGDMQFDRVVE